MEKFFYLYSSIVNLYDSGSSQNVDWLTESMTIFFYLSATICNSIIA